MAWLPLPENTGEALGKGIESGSKLFKGLIEAETFKQDLAYKQALAEQQWREHVENHALRQQQEERLLQELGLAQQLQPYTIQNIMSQIGHRNFEMDPQAQLSMMQNLISGLGTVMPNISEGSGAATGNLGNMDALKAQVFKKVTGIDLNAETPEQKRQREYEEWVQKEEFKRNQDLTKPTQSTITANQEIIGAANSVIPLLEQLRDQESYAALSGPSAGKHKYKTRAGLSTDKLMTALKLPKQHESIQIVKQMTNRQFNESADEFSERVQILIDEIEENARLAAEANQSAKVEPKGQRKLKGTTKEGKSIRVEPEDREDFIKSGGTIHD